LTLPLLQVLWQYCEEAGFKLLLANGQLSQCPSKSRADGEMLHNIAED
jgi:hypothetical protein